MGKEFMAFLKQYGVIGLAIAVIIGGKANSLVTAIVDGALMPIVAMATGGTDLASLNTETFKFGDILSALINFIIVAFLVFLFSKKVLREETVTKK
ncbi:MAG: MscL family protein [Gemmatimonadales bacterium]|nr:MscL family protein [Gemmatimonadota bacterium]MDX2057966.1 MscL family protein [Gemmatimonadales bacterium]